MARADSGVKGDALLTIQVMTEDEWKNQSENTELYKLKQHENIVFVAKLEHTDSKLSLTMEQVEEFHTAVIDTNGIVELNLQNATPGNKTLAISFAREFDSLDEETSKRIFEILKRHKED